LIDALHQSYVAGIEPDPDSWRVQRAVVKFLETAWREPDEGIWEVRGPRRHFTHSKVMAWVAFDRAVCNVEKFGLEGPADCWRRHRDELREEICARGFNRELGAFTQQYDSDKLDASLLMLPLVGFLPPEDPRVRGTVAAVERGLLEDGFVMRYRPDESASVDGLPPGEGAFLPCSFWLADNYALLGRRDEARELFERLLGLRNDLGLIAEEYDPREKRLVGNFPQAFSHVAIVNTAHNLCQMAGPAEQRRQSARDPKAR
jgi:GH15 family glucan-1,4-alpha-glucosidase